MSATLLGRRYGRGRRDNREIIGTRLSGRRRVPAAGSAATRGIARSRRGALEDAVVEATEKALRDAPIMATCLVFLPGAREIRRVASAPRGDDRTSI